MITLTVNDRADAARQSGATKWVGVEVTCVDLADDELAAVSGSSVSGVLKTRHDTAKANIADVR